MSLCCFMCSACTAVTDSTEKNSAEQHAVQIPLLGRLSTEAAKRTVILSGIKTGTDRQVVEKLVGNMKRVRQLRYPVVVQEDAAELHAAVIYRGKRDALKAVQRLNSQTFAGFMPMLSV